MLQSPKFTEKHLKLLYFITKSEGGGGAQTHVMQLARFMVSQGHEVAIMSQPGGWLAERAQELGVTYLENPHIDNTLNPLRLWHAGQSLIQAIKTFAPDLISCHSTIAGLVGRFTVRGRIPTIFTAHGWGFAPGIPQPRRALVALAERLAAPKAEKIICVSEFDRQLALAAGVGTPAQLMTIHNGVEEITSPQQEIEARNDEGEDMVKALFVGRLAPQKDPLVLVRAVAALPQDIRAKLELTIIGNGPLEQPTRELIASLKLEDTITLLPRLERRDLFARYGTSDLFILTSHWEGLPRSILEAMAHNLPIIATDVGGVAEAVGEDAGLLVPEHHQGALTQALKRLISDKKLRQNMGAAGRAKTLGDFSLERMCNKTEEVYKAIV